MTHRAACLLHFLAAHPESPQMLINHPVLLAAMDEVIACSLARHPKDLRRVEMDKYWVELTEKGADIVRESLTTMETLT